jgi:hypothetical protein
MARTLWIGLVIGALAAASVVLLGCPKAGSGPNPPHPGAGFDERQECTTDSDCVAVEIECCDHCNGGTVVGVHRDSADEVKAQYAPPSKCQTTACTEMACAQAVPFCRDQRCGVSVAGAEQLTPLPRP